MPLFELHIGIDTATAGVTNAQMASTEELLHAWCKTHLPAHIKAYWIAITHRANVNGDTRILQTAEYVACPSFDEAMRMLKQRVHSLRAYGLPVMREKIECVAADCSKIAEKPTYFERHVVVRRVGDLPFEAEHALCMHNLARSIDHGGAAPSYKDGIEVRRRYLNQRFAAIDALRSAPIPEVPTGYEVTKVIQEGVLFDTFPGVDDYEWAAGQTLANATTQPVDFAMRLKSPTLGVKIAPLA